MTRFILRPRARREIVAIEDYYLAIRPSLSEDWIDAANEAIRSAADEPQRYPSIKGRTDVRRVQTRRFPYHVYFLTFSDSIVVFSVVHAARSERLWKDALRDEPPGES